MKRSFSALRRHFHAVPTRQETGSCTNLQPRGRLTAPLDQEQIEQGKNRVCAIGCQRAAQTEGQEQIEKGMGQRARESAQRDRKGDRHADRQRVTDWEGQTEEKKWQEKSEKQTGERGKNLKEKEGLQTEDCKGKGGKGRGQLRAGPPDPAAAVRPRSQGSDSASASLPPRCLIV